MIDENKEKQQLINLIKISSFLVANVVKDIKEWNEWGIPFIEINIEAQFDDSTNLRENILNDIQSSFFPHVGHGLSLISEENANSFTNEKQEKIQDGYTIIHKAENFIQSILVHMVTENDESSLDYIINQYMNNFFHHLLKIGTYDARSRTIAKRMCGLLNITCQDFSELETKHWKQLLDNAGMDDGFNRNSFSIPFNDEVTTIPTNSLVLSFRLWRVAFIAAAGGAMMTLATRVAAPTIIETILPLMCASTTIGQFSFALHAVLSITGLTGAAGSLGAFYAGYKMLKRTEPLKEFVLEPLHPTMETVTDSVFIHSDPFIALLNTPDTLPTDKDAKDSSDGLPIYIVISGQASSDVDPKHVWGANFRNTIHSVPLHHTSVSCPSDSLVATTIAHGSKSNNKHRIPTIYDDLPYESLDESHQEPLEKKDPPAEHNVIHDWEDVQRSPTGWWRSEVSPGEDYILRWDPDVLHHLDDSLQKMFTDKVHRLVLDEILKYTPVHALQSMTTLPMLVLNKIKEIDDPWVVAMDRSRQAGILLARVLLAERLESQLIEKKRNLTSQQPYSFVNQSIDETSILGKGSDGMENSQYHSKVKEFVGKFSNKLKFTKTVGNTPMNGSDLDEEVVIGYNRPITLVGYGMGARVIFHCLETLCNESGADNDFGRGIIENAVLIGAPVSTSHTSWMAARSVVAGRLVNCYSTNDWLLALMYRSKTYDIGVAGISPITLGTNSNSVTRSALSMYKADTSSAPMISIKAGLEAIVDVENVDVSHLIQFHSDYPIILPQIMQILKL